ncbi:LysR substrate-binding domain-containing protein [Afifella sp. YEN Y35]|uniref:LysR substrate-binding domain-containing protein n=1 Tax=Afifella sp. YEN Y35 TaxID=3388337 RepID=UPI0039E1FCD2
MKIEPNELRIFVDVAKAGGFRDAARLNGKSPSWLSQTVRSLEDELGVRLFNRTTRSVALTDAGSRLLERLAPAFSEMDAALEVINGYRDRPAGTVRLNVPTVATRLILPSILPPFLAVYPDIRVEVVVDESYADLMASRCDAGIRYEERLEADMIAVPIGPRSQRFATAASPGYLKRRGTPEHPRDLLSHACLCARFPSGVMATWEFERDGEVLRIDPSGPLMVQAGGSSDLIVETAIADIGIIHLFEGWLAPYLKKGLLEPVLKPWWQSFSGPFLYYPSRRLLPAPVRAFVDFVKTAS